MRYKVTEQYKDGEFRDFSLGYPTKGAAGAAARRLNQNTVSRRYGVEEMTELDELLANELEELERE